MWLIPASASFLRSAGVVAVGNLAGAALGFLVLVVLTRSLTPAEFGLIATVIAVVDGGQLFVDTFVNVGIVHSAASAGEATRASPRMLRAGLWIKIVLSLALLAPILVFAPQLSGMLTETAELQTALRFAAAAIVVASLQSFLITVAQSHQRFAQVAALTPAKNLARLACIVGVVLLGGPEVETLAAAVALGALLAFCGSVSFASRELFRLTRVSRADIRTIMQINLWMIFVALSAIAGRINIWLVGVLNSTTQAGFYAAGLQLCMAVGILSQAIVTTVLPKAAKPWTGMRLAWPTIRSHRLGPRASTAPSRFMSITTAQHPVGGGQARNLEPYGRPDQHAPCLAPCTLGQFQRASLSGFARAAV